MLNKDNKDGVLNKLNKLSRFIKKALFKPDENNIEEYAVDPNKLKEKARPFFKALGFKGKVTTLIRSE
jgi:hypothetical protein